jgi:hypothetical protein
MMLSVTFSSRRGRRTVGAVLSALVLGLVGASIAYADTPSVSGYTGPGGKTEDTVGPSGTLPGGYSGTAPTQAVAPAEVGGNEVLGANASGGKPAGTGGTAPAEATAPIAAQAKNRLVGKLPFTGLDLALLAVAGLGLAGLGFGLRRLTGSQPQAG